jgi:hypothetical protein
VAGFVVKRVSPASESGLLSAPDGGVFLRGTGISGGFHKMAGGASLKS